MSGLETLLDIEMVMRVHWDARYVPDVHSEQAMKIKRRLEALGLIVYDPKHERYMTTERGTVYVEAIRALPLPVSSWRMP